MNRQKLIALSALGCFIAAANALAFDIPAYISDPQKVSDNICVIIRENTPVRRNAQDAQNLSEKTNETIIEYAAKLYAEALSIRAGMSAEGGAAGTAKAVAEKAAGALLGSSDKQEVLQNDVKPQVKSIALHLKQIVELEAAIANLQGAQLLSAMDEVRCEDVDEEGE